MKILFLMALLFSNVAMAQNVAIRKCQNSPNGGDLPANWPCDVREIGVATSYSAEPGPWLIVTEAQLVSYKATHQAAYDSWVATHTPAPRPGIQEILKDFEARIKALEVKAGI